MSQTETALSPMQVYFVKNNGDQPFSDMIGGKKVLIPPGQSVAVPFEAIDCWFGNPFAINDETRNIHTRRDEYNRLRVRYGAYDNMETWEENKPNVEVTDIDGKRVITVIDDPFGDSVTPSTDTKMEADLLKSTIDNMQRQITNLQAALADKQRQDQGEIDAEIAEEVGDVSEDTPAQIKTGFYK